MLKGSYLMYLKCELNPDMKYCPFREETHCGIGIKVKRVKHIINEIKRMPYCPLKKKEVLNDRRIRKMPSS